MNSNKLVLGLILFVFIGLHRTGCTLIDFRPPSHRQDPIAVNPRLQPSQTEINSNEIRPIIKKISGETVTLTPKAEFKISGRVVSKRHYYLDTLAKLSPVDLALAWGPLSSRELDPYVSYRHSDRYYSYNYKADFPLNPGLIAVNTANEHLIPSNETIRKAIKSIKIDELVELSGYLVDIQLPTGDGPRTSLTRKDTGAGACEIIYVQQVKIGHEVFK